MVDYSFLIFIKHRKYSMFKYYLFFILNKTDLNSIIESDIYLNKFL